MSNTSTTKTNGDASKSKPIASKNKESGANNMPLFFQDPKAITKERHTNAGLSSASDYAFAKDTNAVALNAVEFIEAAKHYPIVFTGEKLPTPTAVLGIGNKNVFVEDSIWEKGRYIPAYVRRYPFTLADVNNENLLLCVDEKASNYAANEAEYPFYDDKGEHTSLIKNAVEFCKSFQGHFLATQEFSKKLKELNLLVQNRADFKKGGKNVQTLGGFYVIDREKFAKLSDEQTLELNKQGYLPLIFFCLQSQTNWKNLDVT